MKKVINFLVLFLATGFGSGYLPLAPATWGSAVMMVAGFWLLKLPIGWYLTVAGALFLLGILIVPAADKHFRIKTSKEWDNRPIVIDEWVGMLITYLPLFYFEKTWLNILIGFILFRVFDVLKFGLARWSDKKKNKWGVMLDDLFAGVHAALGLFIVLWLIKLFF